ncbi:hypothetical protein [Mucilaginibacter sp. HD30]
MAESHNTYSKLLNEIWRFLSSELSYTFTIHFLPADKCIIYSDDFEITTGVHSWSVENNVFCVSIDSDLIILKGNVIDEQISGELRRGDERQTLTGEILNISTNNAIHKTNLFGYNWASTFNGYWMLSHSDNPLNFIVIEFCEGGEMFLLRSDWQRESTNTYWEYNKSAIKFCLYGGMKIYSLTFKRNHMTGMAITKTGHNYSLRGTRCINIGLNFYDKRWKFTLIADKSNFIVDFHPSKKCTIYNENLELIDGEHTWKLCYHDFCFSIDGKGTKFFGIISNNMVSGDAYIENKEFKFLGERNEVVKKSNLNVEVSSNKKQKLIWFTKATKVELDAKLGKSEFFHIPGRPPRKIRERLVYHIDQRCAYALKDYEVAGEIIAYNSGVVDGEYNGFLELCKCCGSGFYTPCDRCGGSGNLSQYIHVEGGVCFKCGGEGYDVTKVQ